MIRTMINGQDVSHRLLRGGGVKINNTVEDVDGKQNISVASIKLGNPFGEFDYLFSSTNRTPIELIAGQTLIFKGFVSSTGGAYREHEKTLELEIISKEAEAFALFKSVSFKPGTDWPGDTIQIKHVYSAPNGSSTVPRRFVAVNDVFSRMASRFNFGYIQEPTFDNMFVGGTIVDQHFAPFCGGWTYAEFISRFCKAFNCLWRYNALTNRLQVTPRVNRLGAATTDLPVRIKKNSLQRHLNDVGTDSLTYRYSNQPANTVHTEATRTKTGSISVTRVVDSDFRCPTFGTGSFINNAHIDAGETDVGIYIMYSTGGEPSQHFTIPAGNILDAYFAFELRGLDRVECEIFLHDFSAAQLLALANSFYDKVRLPDGRLYHLSNVEIDWGERIATITGVRYGSPS